MSVRFKNESSAKKDASGKSTTNQAGISKIMSTRIAGNVGHEEGDAFKDD